MTRLKKRPTAFKMDGDACKQDQSSGKIIQLLVQLTNHLTNLFVEDHEVL